MTVGISLAGRTRAFGMVDSQGTRMNRGGASIDKLAILNGNSKIKGFYFAAGDTGTLRLGSETAAEAIQTAETIREVTDAVYQKIRGHVQEGIDNHNVIHWTAINHDAEALFPDPEERIQYLQAERGGLLKKNREHLERADQGQHGFVLFSPDEGLKQYFVSAQARAEVALIPMLVGSGNDGADWYIQSEMQDIPIHKLSHPELAYHVAGMFQMATLIEGVGGTPRAVKQEKDRVELLSMEQSIAIANLVGAHLARAMDAGFGVDDAFDLIERIQQNDPSAFSAGAREVKRTEEDFRNVFSPYTHLKAAANRAQYAERP